MSEFRARQNGITVAQVSGPNAEDIIWGYAFQNRDAGPVTIQRQARKLNSPDGAWWWKRHALLEQWPAPPGEGGEHG